MYYKVFIKNIEITIADKQVDGSFVVSNFTEASELYNLIDRHDITDDSVIVFDEKGEFWDSFLAYHKLIEAAGGVVLNDVGELLVIQRLGMWDLPKGKLEKDETIEECAIREVEEECSLVGLAIKKALPSTYHTYLLGEKPILKKTYWFEMTSSNSQNLNPQIEEDITEVRFMNKQEVKSEVLPKTYASLMPLFYTYLFGDK